MPTRTNVYLDPWIDTSITPTIGGCVDWDACDPSIVVLVHGENSIEVTGNISRNTYIHEMPALIPRPYGSRFHYVVQQWMTDPLWVPPSAPCCINSEYRPDRGECNPLDPEDFLEASEIYHTWEEDDGSCELMVQEVEYTLAGIIYIQHHYYPMRPFVEARETGLSPYTLPEVNCAYPHTYMRMMTGACWSHDFLNTMDGNLYVSFINKYGIMCPTCTPPQAGVDYWGQYAPWKVSTNQAACLQAAYPVEDSNPIVGGI